MSKISTWWKAMNRRQVLAVRGSENWPVGSSITCRRGCDWQASRTCLSRLARRPQPHLSMAGRLWLLILHRKEVGQLWAPLLQPMKKFWIHLPTSRIQANWATVKLETIWRKMRGIIWMLLTVKSTECECLRCLTPSINRSSSSTETTSRTT